jgi:antitoxin component YwqK of YwqJK toxin-antitoxin module
MINRIKLLLFIGLIWGQEEYNINYILEQNGLYVKELSDEIVNGNVYQVSNDIKVFLGKMKNGKKVGLWTEWYSKQRKLEEHYKNGILDGSVSLFYKTGQREWRHTYNNGQPEGLWTYWYEDGRKMKEGNFDCGDSTGIWFWWDKNGYIKKEKRFKKRNKSIWANFNEYVLIEVIKVP